MKRTIAAPILLAMLVACGGNGSGGETASYDSPQALAEALGCESSYEDEPGAVGAAVDQIGTCDYDGKQVTLMVGEEGQIDATAEVARGFTAGAGLVKGDGWGVLTQTAALAESAAEDIGGDVS